MVSDHLSTWWEAIGAEMEREAQRERLIAERVLQARMERVAWQAGQLDGFGIGLGQCHQRQMEQAGQTVRLRGVLECVLDWHQRSEMQRVLGQIRIGWAAQRHISMRREREMERVQLEMEQMECKRAFRVARSVTKAISRRQTQGTLGRWRQRVARGAAMTQALAASAGALTRRTWLRLVAGFAEQKGQEPGWEVAGQAGRKRTEQLGNEVMINRQCDGEHSYDWRCTQCEPGHWNKANRRTCAKCVHDCTRACEQLEYKLSRGLKVRDDEIEWLLILVESSKVSASLRERAKAVDEWQQRSENQKDKHKRDHQGGHHQRAADIIKHGGALRDTQRWSSRSQG